MNSETLEAARQVARLGQRPAWHDLARCAETDPEMFFPEKGESVRPAETGVRRMRGPGGMPARRPGPR